MSCISPTVRNPIIEPRANNTMHSKLQLSCLLLATFLHVTSNFFSLCHGAPQFHHLSAKHSEDGDKNGVAFSTWGMRGYVVEENMNATVVLQNASSILAANKTHRIDPRAKFTYYEGGWNIADEHYHSSVAFTGIPLLAVAATWFFIFGLCLLILSCCRCCRGNSDSYSRIAYTLSLIFLVLLIITAISASGILYTAKGKFRSSTTNILEYLLDQSDRTVETLKDVLNNLEAAKEVGVQQQLFLPPYIQKDIDNLGKTTNISAMIPQTKTQETSKQIRHFLDPVMQVLNIVAALMLLVAFVGFIFSVFGLQSAVYILMIIGWILVTGTFILCGISLILHNAVTDSCVAMEEWVQHPTAHSALSELLPCMDHGTAKATLSISRDVAYLMVGRVNQFISTVANNHVAPSAGFIYYNQSGPLMPLLCSPLKFDSSNRRCAPGAVDLSHASRAWMNYICKATQSGKCTSLGRLTPTSYDQITAAVNVSSTLNRHSSFLVGIVDCTFVRDTFNEISEHHCPRLRRSSYWIYLGLLMVSVAVMLSLILWPVYARKSGTRVKGIPLTSSQSSLVGL